MSDAKSFKSASDYLEKDGDTLVTEIDGFIDMCIHGLNSPIYSMESIVSSHELIFVTALEAISEDKWEKARSILHDKLLHDDENNNTRFLLALTYAHGNIREARYDLAMFHLTEVIKKQETVGSVSEQLRQKLVSALKLQEKFKRMETSAEIKIENETGKGFCCF